MSESKRLKQLEEENARLKRIVADLTLDMTALKDALSKKVGKPALKQQVAEHFVRHFGLS